MSNSAASSKAALYVPFALYGLTGFTGLLAEQGFERYIALLVGATASASAVVIFAYFLGFALGAWAVGRVIRTGHIAEPLKVYGVLELLVGVTCIVFSYGFHPLVSALAPLQPHGAAPALTFLLRFAFGGALVLPTAALMGASFPLIAMALDRDDSSEGWVWTAAYGINLAGAAIAALSGSFFLLPALGVRGSLWLCFVIAAIVCAATFRVRLAVTATSSESSSEDEPRHELDRETKLLLGGAFASGLIFFALEIIWTHLIGTTIGNSIYAFSSMLVMVLTGLWLGARNIRRSIAQKRPTSYSRQFQFAGLLLLVQYRCWDYAQAFFIVPLPRILHTFYGVEFYKLFVAALLIVPSATLLGSIFPHLLASPVLRRPGNSYLVGYLSTANSIGCLSGVLLGTFFLIPVVGSELSMKVMVVMLLTISIFFLRTEIEAPNLWKNKAWIKAVLGVVLLTTYAFMWKWDRTILTSGLNVYFGGGSAVQESLTTTPIVKAAEPAKPAEPEESVHKMLSFNENTQGGITTVVETTTKKPSGTTVFHTLFSNGKFQGDDSTQGAAQAGVAVIPSLFTAKFDRALLIGLGTGHSAYALRHTGYHNVDIAEFSPGIVKAASTYFRKLNGAVLEDPQVHLAQEDGRNMLLADRSTKYDLITIELTSIWFAGATNLYSREFYELADQRLNPDGVLQQWVQFHHISPAEISSAVATARAVFPYVSLWFFGSQGMIVATHHPQTVDRARLDDLARKLSSMSAIKEDPALLADNITHAQILGTSGVERMLHELHPVINTDHNRWIEYMTPRYNSSDFNWEAYNLAQLAIYSDAGPRAEAK